MIRQADRHADHYYRKKDAFQSDCKAGNNVGGWAGFRGFGNPSNRFARGVELGQQAYGDTAQASARNRPRRPERICYRGLLEQRTHLMLYN